MYSIYILFILFYVSPPISPILKQAAASLCPGGVGNAWSSSEARPTKRELHQKCSPHHVLLPHLAMQCNTYFHYLLLLISSLKLEEPINITEHESGHAVSILWRCPLLQQLVTLPHTATSNKLSGQHPAKPWQCLHSSTL